MSKTTKADNDDQVEIMAQLGGTIALLRKEQGLSIREMAEEIGISHSDLFRIETGASSNPSLFLIRKIAQRFEMSIDQILRINVEKCPTCQGAGWIRK